MQIGLADLGPATSSRRLEEKHRSVNCASARLACQVESSGYVVMSLPAPLPLAEHRHRVGMEIAFARGPWDWHA